ncbi:MAG: hypothetical protein KGM24_14540 [Elusimicrobia bacterium]|nr:hypothetical protein [Elusimicrobiota bacterium]
MTLLLIALLACPAQASRLVNSLGENTIEAAIRSRFPQVVRQDNDLAIHTKDRIVTFKGNSSAGESGAKYAVVNAYKISTTRIDFLVREHLYEGGRLFLVDGMTGTTVTVAGEPILSPWLNYYLSSSPPDSEEGSGTLMIHRVSDLSLEYSHDFGNDVRPPAASGPQTAAWISPSKIFYLRKTDVRGKSSLESFILERKDGKWVESKMK